MKQLKILLLLKNKTRDWYLADLAKGSDSTYVHTHNFLKGCEALGITTSEKHGKLKVIKLTEKGEAIVENLANAHAILSKEAPPPQPPAPEPKPPPKP